MLSERTMRIVMHDFVATGQIRRVVSIKRSVSAGMFGSVCQVHKAKQPVGKPREKPANRGVAGTFAIPTLYLVRIKRRKQASNMGYSPFEDEEGYRKESNGIN